MSRNRNQARKYRAPHDRKHGFVQISNKTVDAVLPANAFQTLSILLRDEDSFTPSKGQILRRVTFGAKALDTALKWLQDNGYLRIEQDKIDAGKWAWTVAEVPSLLPSTPDPYIPHGGMDDGGAIEDYDEETREESPASSTVTYTDSESVTSFDTGIDITTEKTSRDNQEASSIPVQTTTWRESANRDTDFTDLDRLRRDMLGVDDVVRLGDYQAFVSAWEEFKVWTDDDADSRKALTEIIVGASHDPRGLAKRRQFSSWSELLDTTTGDRDRCRAWFVVYELDQPVTDPAEIRRRGSQVFRAGLMTVDQRERLKLRHPQILDHVDTLRAETRAGLYV